MNIPEIIAYITIGYFFVTLSVLYILGRSSFNADKRGRVSRKDIDVFEEHEEYRKAA
ncbi:MAG: hypothetical protein IT392_00945 [Nitrospirae bacterium]|nr:hypothetical protein [Nitrospirota bacterium]